MKKILLLLMIPIAILPTVNSCSSKPEKESPAPLLDVKTFFKNGEKVNFQISPDGVYYSYLLNYKDYLNVFVQKTDSDSSLRVTNDTLRSIYGYTWKGGKVIYLQDMAGDENYQLFSVNPDGSNFTELTPFPEVKTTIINSLRDIPGKEKELIIGLNKRTREHFDPYLLNIETGKLDLLYANQEDFDRWFTDNAGVIRMASKSDGVNNTWYYRSSDDDPFSLLFTTSFKESFTPTSFDKDNKNMYVLTNLGRDKIVLAEYNPEENKEIKELYSNASYDLSSAFYDKKKQVLAWVNWNAEKPQRHYFDPEWQEIQQVLDTKFEGAITRLVVYDDARTKGIVDVYSDRNPGMNYLFDFKTKTTEEVANNFPWIDEKQMCYMKPIVYKSRDGLDIHGYLTLPIGIEAKNLPVVINPHGGPWHRDFWGFNPEVQFLANRGYAVLQMNFRGSTGYGKRFYEASFKEWGKKMQDDITDGVEWLIDEGIADKKRIAIYGASYGGYATLAGVTFTPDLYAAAVDYVGVSNLFTFLNTIPPYWKPLLDQFYEMVGDPAKDSVLLAEASPVLHADKIRTPLFIAQGANDPRVNKDESDQMVAALKKQHVEVEYMVKDNEGHGFINQNNQYDFYGAMEKFLEKHLKRQ